MTMTDEELEKHAGHLAYEVSMLVRIAEHLHAHTDPQSDTEIMINNALIEAFAVHARNVADFLNDKVRKTTSMRLTSSRRQRIGRNFGKEMKIGKLSANKST